MSKYFILLLKSFLGNFYRRLATFYWSHWKQERAVEELFSPFSKEMMLLPFNYKLLMFEMSQIKSKEHIFTADYIPNFFYFVLIKMGQTGIFFVNFRSIQTTHSTDLTINENSLHILPITLATELTATK